MQIDYRSFLESRGFIVARQPFPGSRGPLWFAQEPVVDPAVKRERFGSHNLLIDLASGEWQRWGERDWRSFDRGPWHETLEEEPRDQQTCGTSSAAPAAPPEGAAVLAPEWTADGRPVRRLFTAEDLRFFDDCIAAGFTITQLAPQLLDGDLDIGNRWAARDGVSYLLICQTNVKSIIGPGLQRFTLADFRPHQKAREIAAPLPRRELSAVGIIVQSSGRSLQKGLF